jgi:hypothetical protein
MKPEEEGKGGDIMKGTIKDPGIRRRETASCRKAADKVHQPKGRNHEDPTKNLNSHFELRRENRWRYADRPKVTRRHMKLKPPPKGRAVGGKKYVVGEKTEEGVIFLYY